MYSDCSSYCYSTAKADTIGFFDGFETVVVAAAVADGTVGVSSGGVVASFGFPNPCPVVAFAADDFHGANLVGFVVSSMLAAGENSFAARSSVDLLDVAVAAASIALAGVSVDAVETN